MEKNESGKLMSEIMEKQEEIIPNMGWTNLDRLDAINAWLHYIPFLLSELKERDSMLHDSFQGHLLGEIDCKEEEIHQLRILLKETDEKNKTLEKRSEAMKSTEVALDRMVELFESTYKQRLLAEACLEQALDYIKELEAPKGPTIAKVKRVGWWRKGAWCE